MRSGPTTLFYTFVRVSITLSTLDIKNKDLHIDNWRTYNIKYKFYYIKKTVQITIFKDKVNKTSPRDRIFIFIESLPNRFSEVICLKFVGLFETTNWSQFGWSWGPFRYVTLFVLLRHSELVEVEVTRYKFYRSRIFLIFLLGIYIDK